MRLRLLALIMLSLYGLAFGILSGVAFNRDSRLTEQPLVAVEPVSLGRNLSYRLDFGEILDITELRATLKAMPFIDSAGRTPNLGLRVFEGAYIWLRLTPPELTGDEDDWTLWFEDRFARKARLIIDDGTTSETHDWVYGDHANLGLAQKSQPVFQLDRRQLSGKTLYLAVYSFGPLKGNVFIAKRPVFEQIVSTHMMYQSFLNGAVAALAVYLGAIGLRLRERSMAYAAALAFFLMIRNFAESGLHHALLLPSNPNFADVLLYGTQPVGISFWLLFTSSFIRLKTYAPRLDTFLKLVAIVIPLQGPLVIIKGAFWTSMPFNIGAALPTLIGMLCGFAAALWLAARGNSRAWYFLMCWMPLALGLFLRIASAALPSWDPDLGIFTRPGADLTISLLALAVLLTVDLRQRERRLTLIAERNEQRARDYAEIGTDGVFEVGPDGVIRSAAGPLSRLLELEAGRHFITSLPGLSQGVVGTLERVPLRAFEFANGGEDDAATRWISLSTVPIVDEDGHHDGFRAVVSDITSNVVGRADESRRNTLAALGHLAGGIAHEVNNFLHPIISLSRHVAEQYVTDPDGRRLLGLVVTSGIRAGEIVRSVLRAYAPDGFAGAAVPIQQAVRDAVDTVRVTVPVTCQLDSMIEAVDTPQVRLGEMIQVLSNLVSNSLRATANIGHISIRLATEAGRPVLTVVDNGHGMPETIRKRATEPFMTGSVGGIGLGLSIVRRIVSSWNADLQILSVTGEGTTIRIVFAAENPVSSEDI